MSNPGDCTAVVMAAGTGSRMTDLTSQCPKALLPVGRFPMIWYPIRSLEKAGFTDIIVITRQSWQDQIQKVLVGATGTVTARLEIVAIPDSVDWGTADSLRHIANKIKTNVLVISCDLITDCQLSDLMLVHRKYSSSLTVMLSQLPTSLVADTLVPGFKSKQKSSSADRISIGFESDIMGHILFWKAQIDMDDESVSFTKKFLERFPSTRIQSTWTDCHVYIINKFVIKYLSERKEVSSIQGELVPVVVKKQMSAFIHDRPKEDADEAGPGHDNSRADRKKDLVDFAAESESSLKNSVKFLSLTSSSFGFSEDAPQKDLIGCYAYRQTSGFCVRANTIGSYFEACKQMPRLISKFWSAKKEILQNVPESTVKKEKSQVGADCMLGESVILGDKVSIKKSVIGRHCTIGDKVKVTNSVIMDHVTIQESCDISNCIIADSANIGDKCHLSSCIIGHKQSIPTMSKHTNEVVSNLSQMMEV